MVASHNSPFHDTRWHSLAGRCAGPANITSPCNGVELQIIERQLTRQWIGHKLIDTFDLVDALAEPIDDPAKADIGAVVEALENLEGWRGWCIEEGGNVCGLIREGDGIELRDC